MPACFASLSFCAWLTSFFHPVRSWREGDVLGCFLDADCGKVWFSLNGESFSPAFADVHAESGFTVIAALGLGFVGRVNLGSFEFPPTDDELVETRPLEAWISMHASS